MFRESKEIQRRLLASKNYEPHKFFARLYNASLRWIGNNKISVGKCDDDTPAILKSLHSPSEDMESTSALQGPVLPPEPVIFDNIDGDL